jgi:G-patch domain
MIRLHQAHRAAGAHILCVAVVLSTQEVYSLMQAQALHPFQTLNVPPTQSPTNLQIKLQEDVARLPDEADEAAYEAMPIEEFGAAMLRGMGWSEGQVPPGWYLNTHPCLFPDLWWFDDAAVHGLERGAGVVRTSFLGRPPSSNRIC